MESPPNLGLGTINIVPLHGRTNLTITVWVWNLGMRMGRKVLDTQPVGRLPLIVSYVLISLKESSIFIIIHSHTHQHTSSKQLGISSQTLIYIYHTWHYITPKAKSQTWQHQRIIRQHQEHKHIHSNSHTMFIKPKRHHQACPRVGPGRVCAQPGTDPISWGLLNLDSPPIRRRQRFEWSDVVVFRSVFGQARTMRIVAEFCQNLLIFA